MSDVLAEVLIRPGRLSDIPAFADAFRQMWLDNGITSDQVEPDYRERVDCFVRDGIARLEARLFVAQSDGVSLGFACCQVRAGLFPEILVPSAGRRGYIWGVYVAASARRRGIGRRLTEACVEALRQLGCTYAVLHAAPPGRGVYESLGFQGTNELRLALTKPS